MSGSDPSSRRAVAEVRAQRGRNLVSGRRLEAPETPWIHGTRLGREHANVRLHLVEDHGAQVVDVAARSDGSIHGEHDRRHGCTWAYAYDLPHGEDRP